MTDELTDTERQHVIDDLVNHREAEYFASGHITLPSEERENTEAYLEDLTDEDLVEYWFAIVGKTITQLADESPEFREIWEEETDVEGIARVDEWQFEQILDGEGLLVDRPTMGNLMMTAIENAESLCWGIGARESFFEFFDCEIDDNGFVINENGEYKQPYALDEINEVFKPITDVYYDTEDDPLTDRVEHVDRVHYEDVAGVIHPVATASGDAEFLRENRVEIFDLFDYDIVTRDLWQAGNDNKVVVLFHQLYSSYEWEIKSMRGDFDTDGEKDD